MEELKKVKHGYSFIYSKKHLHKTISLPFVDYSHWGDEDISDHLFCDREIFNWSLPDTEAINRIIKLAERFRDEPIESKELFVDSGAPERIN